jgi:serine/threonine protein kinase
MGTSGQRPEPRLGGYLLGERIGQGGMAVIYKAKREGWSGFEKTVVLKAMLPTLASNPEFVDMFIAEAKISAQLSHPGIVQVHDFGVWQGTPYLVMDYLNGINLQQLQAALASGERRMPVAVAVVIVTEMCHALGYAHRFEAPDGTRRQIIHSDVSPANVMVCRDGSVKLLDFGVAKVVDEFDYDTSLVPKGKYAYMSPEQVNRLPIDRRVDVFAAGIVLYELLTGKRLFVGANEPETLYNVDRADVPPPSMSNPDVPPALDRVVLKALKRDPGLRYDDGEEMARALGEAMRIGGGKRRIIELLAYVFPREWTIACQVCGKPVAPGLPCRECGTEAPIELPPPIDGTLPSMLPLEPVDSAPQPVVSEQSTPPETPAQRRRNGLKTATVAVGLLGAVMGVGTSGRARNWLRNQVGRAPVPPPTPTAQVVEGTPTVVAPTPAPAPSAPLAEASAKMEFDPVDVFGAVPAAAPPVETAPMHVLVPKKRTRPKRTPVRSASMPAAPAAHMARTVPLKHEPEGAPQKAMVTTPDGQVLPARIWVPAFARPDERVRDGRLLPLAPKKP